MRNLYADLDLKRDPIGVAACKQYDDVILKLSVYDNGEMLNLDGYTIEMHARKPDNTAYIQNSMITYDDNVVTIECTEQFTVYPGVLEAEVLFINNNSKKKKYSFNLKIKIIKSTLNGAINSESSITLLDQIEEALDELRDISVNLTEAIQVNSELKTNISDGKTLNSNLVSNIDTGTTLNDYLVSNTSSGSTLNDDLKNTIQSGIDVNNALKGNISTGTTLNTNLANNITEGNKTNNTATAINSTLETNIAEGKKTIEELTDANKDYSQHINNMNIHLTEEEKENLLLLFQNFVTLQNKVDRLIGDGFLSDEDGNIYVDENGDTYIT